ncbi:MAG: hypothetical protein QOI95_3010 [Acidimicrobiaceae bacterium]|jgi:dTMP kinase
MEVRTIGRTAIESWLRAVRWPIDAATQLLPNGDSGPRNGAALAVDRADASVRELLGRILNDEHLQDDARRRRVAANERARAIELRLEAEERKREADQQLVQRQNTAEDLRERAEREAAERERQAEQERQERKQRVRETAAKQESAVEHARTEKEKAAEQKAKRERLRVLDQQAEALDTETDALTASDEAQRLAKAAAKAKAARKGTA